RAGYFFVAVQNFDQIVNVHENFADASLTIFAIIGAAYLILWLNRENFFRSLTEKIKVFALWQRLGKLGHFFVGNKFVILLALAGLVCITITGALGGAMVYGPNADPFIKLIYGLIMGG